MSYGRGCLRRLQLFAAAPPARAMMWQALAEEASCPLDSIKRPMTRLKVQKVKTKLRVLPLHRSRRQVRSQPLGSRRTEELVGRLR